MVEQTGQQRKPTPDMGPLFTFQAVGYGLQFARQNFYVSNFKVRRITTAQGKRMCSSSIRRLSCGSRVTQGLYSLCLDGGCIAIDVSLAAKATSTRKKARLKCALNVSGHQD